MLLLLPPSEGKTTPERGRPLDLNTLSFPELQPTREVVLTALERLCSGPAAKARTTLGISERQDLERRRNADLRSAPTAPAGEVYSGVLYDALDLPTLPAGPTRRAATDIAISSALFGLLRVTDRIPAYRLSADTTLPRTGRLATVWRDTQQQAIRAAAGSGIVIDMRSSAYVALGPLPSELGSVSGTVRVLQERAGRLTVVSHHNKATKGRLVRQLLSRPRPRSIANLAEAIDSLGYRVDLHAPRRDGEAWTVDVVVEEL